MGTIRQLFNDNREKLDLIWLVGGEGDDVHPIEPSEHVSSADLVGHLNLIHPDRIQVFGRPEIAYFEHIDERRRQAVLHELAAGHPPAIIAADGLQPRNDMLELCRRENIPLFTTNKDAGEVIDQLRTYLAKIFAPRTTRHGVLMDVLGLGVLITGESGLGKSELALELISRGHGLVADDVVELSRVSPNTVEGRCPRLLANLLEVRGLGLLDIKAIFGETAVRRKMRLKLIVHLVRRSTLEDEYERLPLDTLTEDVLGLAVHKVVIPVAAGRNLAVLLEAAVRNTILQLRGIDTMGEFMKRHSQEIHDNGHDDT